MEEREKISPFLFYLFIFISIVFLILRTDTFINNIRTLFSFIFNPYISVKSIDKIENINHRLKSALLSKIKEELLENEINSLKSKQVLFDAILEENKRLSEILSLKNSIPSSGVFSKVISINTKPAYSFIYIDKGYNDGVKLYNPVLFLKDKKWYIIGRVIETYNNYSKIILLTNSDFSFIADTKTSRGLVSGNFSNKILYRNIDGDFKIGDEIKTSNSSITFPPGLLVGTIIDKKQNGNLIINGIIECFNIEYVDYVYVMNWICPIKEAEAIQ